MSELKLEQIGHPDAVSNSLTFDSDGTIATTTGFSSGGLKVKSSGGGTFSINPPSSASDRTLVLPDSDGTVLTSTSNIVSTLENIGKGFLAWPSSGQTFGNSVTTKINYANEEHDDFNAYNTSTSTFTVPYTGTYLMSVSLRINAGSSNARMEFAVYVNGSLYRCIGLNQQNLNDMQAGGSRIMRLTAGQAVTIYLNQNSGSTLTVINASNFSTSGVNGQGHWQIVLLGAQ